MINYNLVYVTYKQKTLRELEILARERLFIELALIVLIA